MLACFSTRTQTRACLTSGELSLIPAVHPDRREAEGYIARGFLARYGASVSEFHPNLLALRDHSRDLIGAVDYRAGSEGPLILERYLDQSVEKVLERRAGVHLPRSAVVEVGNMIASTPGDARLLICLMTHRLFLEGFAWLVLTVSRTLQDSFRQLGLLPLWLAAADPVRLGDRAAHWGRYFEDSPQVVAEPLSVGYRRLLDEGYLRWDN